MKGKFDCEFRRWRDKLGYTQRQAAKCLGYSRFVIQLYDQGKKEPPLVMRFSMQAILEGIPPYYEDQPASQLAGTAPANSDQPATPCYATDGSW